MINRILFILIFLSLGALANGWWTNRENIMAHHTAKVDAFMAAGPRFTAEDGQVLCERIVELEKQLGIVSSPCNYSK